MNHFSQEEDDSDEEGRVSFSDIKNSRLDEMKKATLGIDRGRMLSSVKAYDNNSDGQEDEDTESLRWEREQIRKGVATLVSL